MEPKAIVPLSERSARSVWKEILVLSVAGTSIAVGLNIWMSQKDWIGHFGKSIEIHALPFLASAVVLGVIWTIRGTFGFFRSNNVAPMDRDDYLRLRDLYGESSDFPSDRLTRWTIAVLLVTGSYAFQAAPDAGDSTRVSIFTLWLPLLMYLSAAVFAFDVTLVCLALAAVAALLWGISLLPIPLAIVVGAGIIAYAIYRRGKSAKSTQPVPEGKDEPEEKTEAQARLEAFQAVLAGANLFAYELNHGLIPDGNSESNPGYGPMDFDEWQEWKQRGFEQTGNLWFNHPDGLPPKESDAA